MTNEADDDVFLRYGVGSSDAGDDEHAPIGYANFRRLKPPALDLFARLRRP